MRLKAQLLFLVLPLTCVILSGCIQKPIPEPTFFTYNQTTLGQSTSGDVLNYIDMSLTTLISKSDTVIASWGESTEGYQELAEIKKGYQQWIDVVAFDEQSAEAVRKYFFFVDEKARRIPFVHPKWTARFDGQLILDKAVLDKPYADENARSIAILKEIQKRFNEDIAKVLSDNKMLGNCQMVVTETFENILRPLDETPAWAIKLDTPEGWTFDSRNFFTGNIHMHEADGIANITIQLGAIPWEKGKAEPGKPYEPPPPPPPGPPEPEKTAWPPNSGFYQSPPP